MKTLCVVLTALLLAASAQARLGETEAQITARLGPPYRRTGDSLFDPRFSCDYRVPGFRISVSFENGVSVKEYYWLDATQIAPGCLRPLTTQEAENIVFANGGQAAWKHVLKWDSRVFFSYQRQNGDEAMIWRDGTCVVVEHKDYPRGY